ncbi:MAG: hypothetical protein KY445_01025 [Armatimonadetes bacterium]|nr:hypothetical protein [Armatimonadota bacterium]
MRPIPQSLQIVAWLFIVGGIFAAINMVVSLLAGRININLGVLTVFIGQGLLRLNPHSLTWAMVSIWLGLVLTPFTAVMFLFNPGDVKIFGLNAGQAPPGLGFVLSVAAFALIFWQYRVLTSHQIRQLLV